MFVRSVNDDGCTVGRGMEGVDAVVSWHMLAVVTLLTLLIW